MNNSYPPLPLCGQTREDRTIDVALFGVAHPAPECEDRASHYLDAEAAYPLLDAAAASAARPPVASAPPPSGAARPRARVLLFLGVTVHLVQLALHLFHLLLQLRLPMPSTPASPWALRTPSELSGGRAATPLRASALLRGASALLLGASHSFGAASFQICAASPIDACNAPSGRYGDLIWGVRAGGFDLPREERRAVPAGPEFGPLSSTLNRRTDVDVL
ncbi:hypothetical protein C6P46_005345 [Rhodotorula mucilaginosa]|uniref:Uncharacterized protein n=1 Tax=Rhodotorula mucilaginosa TaxID=5537 RepID=A0A9P6W0B1_RHOMI|nr:hypothetical protein C6P46_005345 [Rhodotorula mucilaginosa]